MLSSQGIARAFVHMLRHISRPYLERYSAFILEQCLSMLTVQASLHFECRWPVLRALTTSTPPRQGATQQLHDCVTHMLRAGLGESLSERSQLTMAKTLAEHVTARAAAEGVVIVGLKEIAALLLSLREVAASARDVLLQGERPLLLLVEHPARAARLAAGQCLWALVLAFPTQLAGLLNTSLNRVRVEHAKLAVPQGKTAEPPSSALSAHAHVVR